ncbi:MAG: carboxylating nicotinate-nucleotide diphosphorylase, partial [Candidatus Omnitrophica bacterium]|nr:carboxylating nicotinate-nucleotide diphosphorylase [Candidatus Omnitrophota bacterium]
MDYNKKELIPFLRRALREDIGKRDITTRLFIPKDKQIKAVILAKQDCVVCGLDIARLVFKICDKKVVFKARVNDGEFIRSQKILAEIQGSAQGILTAERVALNFLSLLSGIATKTRRYVDTVRPYRVKIMDTRKTLPGLRKLEKYAVKIGGGYNHRMRLDEMVLVKDNHFKVVSPQFLDVSFKKIIERRERKIPKGMKIEVEVKSIEEFKQALKMKPDIIMLDNMDTKEIKRALRIRDSLPATYYPIPKLEVSGGVNLK